MKKNLYLLIVLSVAAFISYSQAPGIFNYQGIARNSVGNVLENKTINLRLTIHDNSATGLIVYQESRIVTTNPFGLFNIQVGSIGANNVTGSIATVNWATGSKYLQVEIDPNGGNSFINLGTSQLASVPYALNAFGAAPTGNAGGDLSGTYPNPTINLANHPDNYWRKNGTNIFNANTGNIGIGINNPAPSAKLDIASNNSGLLIPRMTQTERNTIGTPANGLLIYQTNSTPGFYYYDGASWNRLITGNNIPNSLWAVNGPHIYNTNAGGVGIGTNNPTTYLHIKGNPAYIRLESFYSGLLMYKNTDELGAAINYDISNLSEPFQILSANGLAVNTNYAHSFVSQMRLDSSGQMRIGSSDQGPIATLDVLRGSSGYGTAVFRGTEYNSHFNYSNNEDTYIRAGKQGGKVLLNDIAGLGNVGIGTYNANYKLTVEHNGPGIVQTSNSGVIVGTTNLIPTGNSTLVAGGFGTFSNNALGFFTNNLLKMTIAQDGKIGIGALPSAAKVHIEGNDEALRISGNDGYISFYEGNSYKGFVGAADNDIELGTPNSNTNGTITFYRKGIPQLTILNNDQVRVGPIGCTIPIGVTPPRFSALGTLGIKKDYGDYIGEWAIVYGGLSLGVPNDALRFYYNGGFKAYIDDRDGDWETYSDIRLKENFKSYKSVLNGIKKLDVLTYHYKSDRTGGRSFGLIAQNLQKYFPELVSNGGDGMLGISYSKTGVLAIKAIQEQQVIIEAQQNKINELEKRLTALENKLFK